MRLAKPGDYDINGIRAQKVYEQNPEAQFYDKERLALMASVVREYPSECVFAYYLRMTLVEGYSVREIAKMEETTAEVVQARISYVTEFIKRKLKKKDL